MFKGVTLDGEVVTGDSVVYEGVKVGIANTTEYGYTIDYIDATTLEEID